MVAASFGESHSMRKYVIFGVVTGLLAGYVAVLFSLSLPIVASPAAAVAALLAGRRSTIRDPL
jgi:putative flippase GtrA